MIVLFIITNFESSFFRLVLILNFTTKLSLIAPFSKFELFIFWLFIRILGGNSVEIHLKRCLYLSVSISQVIVRSIWRAL